MIIATMFQIVNSCPGEIKKGGLFTRLFFVTVFVTEILFSMFSHSFEIDKTYFPSIIMLL